MPDIMQELQHDHINVAKLLDLMRFELDALRAGQEVDYPLLFDIMHYMRHYPDRFHHPREELVFAKLVRRDSGSRAAVATLRSQHEECATLGAALIDTLHRATQERDTAAETLCDPCMRYVDLLYGHMNEEEGTVFPLARALLTRADWDDIATSLQCDVDPLIAPELQVAYRSIARALAGGTRQRP